MAEDSEFEIVIRYARCKECGICIAFCPQKVLVAGEDDKPMITSLVSCSGCKICEYRCPDLAVSVWRKGEHGLGKL